MFWYDVCNDLSLENRNDQPLDLADLYSISDIYGGVIYYDNEDGPIYYFGKEGLQGCFLLWADADY